MTPFGETFQKTFDKHKSLLQESLDWKDVPVEVKDEVYRKVKEHNVKTDPSIKGFYAIDVTGKYQVYYTFWRFKDIDPRFAGFIKNPVYMGNLTTDLMSSVDKAIQRVPNVKIEIWEDATKNNLIGKTKDTPSFTFGKYRGRTFPDVYLENPSYFAFLAKNADPKYANTKSSVAIQFFANLYFEEMTKKNQESSTSKFSGTIGGRYEGELEVYNIKEYKNQTNSFTGETRDVYLYKLKDADENKFMCYDLEKKFTDVKVGDKLKVSAKIKNHKEVVGIKFTLLNYVKPL